MTKKEFIRLTRFAKNSNNYHMLENSIKWHTDHFLEKVTVNGVNKWDVNKFISYYTYQGVKSWYENFYHQFVECYGS